MVLYTLSKRVQRPTECTTRSNPLSSYSRYHDAGVTVASDLGISCLSGLWPALYARAGGSGDDSDLGSVFVDGLHFSEAGSDVLYSLLLPEMEKRVPAELNLPEWKTLCNWD